MTLTAIGLLVFLVARLKISAFIALMLSSLFLGGMAVFRGLPYTPVDGIQRALLLTDIVEMFQTGMGKTLGGIGAILCLGAILGKLFGESGGSEVLAKRFTALLGPNRIGWLIPILALSIGLTTWFAVGLLLLLPILLTLARETKRPFLLLALPLLSFLSVMHGIMPPHPGPVIAVAKLHADTGKVLLWGLSLGIPVAAIAGPVFARIAIKRITVNPPAFEPRLTDFQSLPGFGITLVAILLPVALLLLGTIAELTHAADPAFRGALLFIGNPSIALLLTVLFAFWAFGTRCGRSLAQLLRMSEQSIAGIAAPFVIIGAGGGFAKVMTEVGVARLMGELATQANLSPILYGWLVAAFIRVSTGSATVAITVASELLEPVLGNSPDTSKELAIIAIGCGSLFLSHLNDGGFWMVKECFGLSVGETLRTWTVTETLIGVTGLGMTMIAAWLTAVH